MMRDPSGLDALHSARALLAFLNTRPCPACRAGDALDQGLRRSGTADGPRRWRADLATLLDARLDGIRPAPELLRRVNRRLRRLARIPQIAWVAGRLEVQGDPLKAGQRPDEGSGPGADWALLVVNPHIPFARCAADGCRHYLLRHRSNQRWCSPEGCGNRSRVARHYQKLRRASGARAPAPGARPPRRARALTPRGTDGTHRLLRR